MKEDVRKAIQSAFMDLVVEKGFRDVTIAEICRMSHVSKNTLYRYFDSKYAIAEDVFDEQIMRPMRRLLGMLPDLPHGDLHSLVMAKIFTDFAKEPAYWRALASVDGGYPLESMIASSLSEVISPTLMGVTAPAEEAEYRAHFMVSGFTHVYVKWIRDGMSVSPNVVAGFFDEWVVRLWKDLFTVKHDKWCDELMAAEAYSR